ncbi:hypothetical protein Srufu_078990 (plasmid) [Streptomyces libani subsp. rufus]|nr:hypothetical protein Srufu_078990 [Streptomyces libani subsp. rufus]
MNTTLPQRAAHARWKYRRRALLAQGQWQPYVEAGPVRERIREIQAAGMPVGALSVRLGLLSGALEHVLWGEAGVLGQKVRRETAEAVMGYWPALEDFPDASRIDPTGTRRRVQALMTRGWSMRALAAQEGVLEDSFSRALRASRVTACFARMVAALYDRLWDKTPEEFGVSAASAHRMRLVAQRRVLHGPLAWDDDTIDDPAAVPALDAPEPPPTSAKENAAARWLMGESVVLDDQGQREVIAYLMEWTTESPEEIAARLESTPDAVSRRWERIKERARKAGQPVPWRRKLELASRNLTKREMEKAA